jgi:phosphoketolase
MAIGRSWSKATIRLPCTGSWRRRSEIRDIQSEAREGRAKARRAWPIIILNSPKGWTGPKEVDGLKTEGFWRSHQVPFAEMASKPEHVRLLDRWMKSYRPEELFDDAGAPRPQIAALSPRGNRRMSANPHANGGLLMRELDLPEIAAYGVSVRRPGAELAEATAIMAQYLRDVIKGSAAQRNFRVFGPDETASNRLSHVFEATNRAWNAEMLPYDDHLSPDGRVMEVVNVVDLMTLQPHEEHPHGLTDHDFDALFTTEKPVIFAHHGYPWLIHRLTYRRTNHDNIHVRGYREEGTTTTPFDMVVRNGLDRFHLASDVVDRLPQLGYLAAYAKQAMRDKLIEHGLYIREHGEDMPEVKDWHWSPAAPAAS